MFCFGGIAVLFWHQDYRYSLPTPVPLNYQVVPVGQSATAGTVNASLPDGPLFLHFYNPDCPCSRFNAKHLKTLIRTYHDSVRLFIVVPSKNTAERAVKEFGVEQEYIIDETGQLAVTFGVYSTPQAVLVDRQGKLFYRGNYNKSRYCTARATNYAELALIALLNNSLPPQFDLYATQSYGCELQPDTNILQFIF